MPFLINGQITLISRLINILLKKWGYFSTKQGNFFIAR